MVKHKSERVVSEDCCRRGDVISISSASEILNFTCGLPKPYYRTRMLDPLKSSTEESKGDVTVITA